MAGFVPSAARQWGRTPIIFPTLTFFPKAKCFGQGLPNGSDAALSSSSDMFFFHSVSSPSLRRFTGFSSSKTSVTTSGRSRMPHQSTANEKLFISPLSSFSVFFEFSAVNPLLLISQLPLLPAEAACERSELARSSRPPCSSLCRKADPSTASGTRNRPGPPTIAGERDRISARL